VATAFSINNFGSLYKNQSIKVLHWSISVRHYFRYIKSHCLFHLIRRYAALIQVFLYLKIAYQYIVKTCFVCPPQIRLNLIRYNKNGFGEKLILWFESSRYDHTRYDIFKCSISLPFISKFIPELSFYFMVELLCLLPICKADQKSVLVQRILKWIAC